SGFSAPPALAAGPRPSDLALADLNLDGKLDLAVAVAGAGAVRTWLGGGDGTFTAADTLTLGGDLAALAVADFSRDGRPDVAVVNRTTGVGALLGDGTGHLLPGPNLGGGTGAEASA